MQDSEHAEETARLLLQLEEEREISGTLTSDATSMAEARATLRAWVDTVVTVVAVPGSGKVSLVHADGKTSHIASSALAYQLSPKVRFD